MKDGYVFHYFEVDLVGVVDFVVVDEAADVDDADDLDDVEEVEDAEEPEDVEEVEDDVCEAVGLAAGMLTRRRYMLGWAFATTECRGATTRLTCTATGRPP